MQITSGRDIALTPCRARSLRYARAALLTLAVSACGGGESPTPPPPPALKAWQGAALLETDNAGNAFSPQIAVDASGNALTVWTQSEGTRDNIWANVFR